MNDKSILLKLFLLTIFIGNVSMNFLGEGSNVLEIPSYGWLSYGDAIHYLDRRPELTTEQKGLPEAQNAARRALDYVNMKSAERAFRHYDQKEGYIEEWFTALLWLIGVADGKLEDWKKVVESWNKNSIPEGKARFVTARSGLDEAYKWYDEAMKEKKSDENPVEVIALYWVSILHSFYDPEDSTSG